MRAVSVFSALFLTACVTINIYFPAAAAEKVADEIIKGIQSESPTDSEPKALMPPQTKMDEFQAIIFSWTDAVVEFVIPSAHAGNADLSVNTAEIRQLRASMSARFATLKSFYDAAVIGIQSDGFITVKGSVALKDRNTVNKLVAAENSDRQALYQAIANANGHPEWFAQIKSTFAASWVENAQPGWWYQSSNGNWNQK